jgi:flagellar biosynthesis chaperone FliJ
MKKENNIEELFKNLKGEFDHKEPSAGHQDRFLAKLNTLREEASSVEESPIIALHKNRTKWFKYASMAAALALLLTVGWLFFNTPSKQEQLAEISPEISNTQVYFTSLIKEQVALLEAQGTPETKVLITDTLIQLQRLEKDYQKLENDLLSGGNSKFILSAMITNFQTRIDLLNEVMTQIESIKNVKVNKDANYTI